MAKRVEFTETRTMHVELPGDEADYLLNAPDHLDVCEAGARFLRIAAGHVEHFDIAVDVGEPLHMGDYDPVPIDGSGRERFLWYARSFVQDARRELSVGRYQEGKVTELDEVNRDLAAIEDRLRVMALAAEGLDEHHRPLKAGS